MAAFVPASDQTTRVVSICIANYNGMEVIDDCIHSILDQQGEIPVEILIHDDASTDDSVAHIKAHYPMARLIESPDNVGFCIANNRMAAQAQGKYLLLLNNDAALFPDALQTLFDEAERLDQAAILSVPQYDAQTGELIDIGCLLDPFFNPVPNRNPQRRDVGMVIGACLWIAKAQWEELGGFPEWFGSIGEDLYLCCRARLAGYPVQALGVSGYRHRVGTSFGGGKTIGGQLATTFRRRALSERNKTFVMATTCPAPVAVVLLPLHLTLLLLEGSLLSLFKLDGRYLGRIYLSVFGALFWHRNELLVARASTQASRLLTSTDFFTVFDRCPYKLRMLLRHGLPTLR